MISKDLFKNTLNSFDKKQSSFGFNSTLFLIKSYFFDLSLESTEDEEYIYGKNCTIEEDRIFVLKPCLGNSGNGVKYLRNIEDFRKILKQ